MKNRRIVVGQVISLPKDTTHCGVVLSSTRMKNGWYKVTILEYGGGIATCKLKAKEDGKHLWYRNYFGFDTTRICKLLSTY